MKKINDLSNKKFNRLTALYVHSKDRNGNIRWHCKCDCGKEKDILASHLVAGNIKSCGCAIRFGKDHKQWTGVGDLSGQFWNQIERGANGSKGRKKLEFDITKEYAWNLFLAQDSRCALSGIELYLPKRWNDTTNASLDRIDSSMGYVEGNVQWIHKDINKMKNSFNQEYFISMCKLISNIT